jgi:hypothetical protein
VRVTLSEVKTDLESLVYLVPNVSSSGIPSRSGELADLRLDHDARGL